MKRRSQFLVFALFGVFVSSSQADGSRCFGTPGNGRVEDAVSLPLSGENFTAYSLAGWTVGRTYVHSSVRDIVVDAYAALVTAAPDRVFVYGETGWRSGGQFRPHKTHQNGLSVDLMVPVLQDGESVPLPGNVLNRYGYDIEFNDQGRADDYQIDFQALAELIYQVHLASKSRRIAIRRVIFEVPLQRKLWPTTRGPYLRKNVTFSTKQAWVRHDEHIHIDFDIQCARL